MYRRLAAVLCPAVLLVSGCAADPGERAEGPGLSVPEVFYLRPHGDREGAKDKTPFRVAVRDGTGLGSATGEDGRLTMRLEGPGKDVRLKISTPRDCRGDDREVTCTVPATWSNWGGPWLVAPVAAKGGRVGARAVVRYRYTTAAGAVLTGRTRLVVGEPVLHVRTPAKLTRVSPGAEVQLPLTVRNTGEADVVGLAFGVSVQEGMSLEPEAENCRYQESRGTAVCTLPGLRVPAGGTVTLAPALIAVAGGGNVRSGIVQEAWPLDVGPRQYSHWPDGGDPGRGPALSAAVTPGGDGSFSDGAEASTIVELDVTSDYAAVGDTLSGEPGSEREISVGVKNLGPGKGQPARVRFTVPEGTRVVKQPMTAIDEDAYEPACERDTVEYTCTVYNLEPGATETFGFTLHIEYTGGRGTVTVDGGRWDHRAANDTAPVTVSR
ncbi:hypothetical protein SRB5_64540 [Streptomyces sp. RB5]|uniref:DUF11 domain-containing protein n=1 Tax=Streptomyces smaragdinus TaxID=2585196 RepID=A0A7K0CRY0_9ACTN|nr:DUF11 domain-containing protein [Streptomyces smaragdinus]MQY16256.1 hypothetical protein [Streptomyces smaragdinus]